MPAVTQLDVKGAQLRPSKLQCSHHFSLSLGYWLHEVLGDTLF